MAEDKRELAPASKQEIANAIGNTTIADSILKSFNQLATQNQLVFPKGYNVGNQLKLMYTDLVQKNLLSGVTPISVGQALTEACIQGLEIDKKQVYFIKYANQLVMFRSYFGDVAVALGTKLVTDVRARVIYEGDEYDLEVNELGEEYITGHKTKLENRDKGIVGAYAWAELPNGRRNYCIMTINEIKTSWKKSKSSGVQQEYPQEMAKRTVIRRLVKTIFNTASCLTQEQEIVINSYNKTTEQEYDNDYSVKKSTVKNTIDEVDNIKQEDIDDDYEVPFEEPKEKLDDVSDEELQQTLF